MYIGIDNNILLSSGKDSFKNFITKDRVTYTLQSLDERFQKSRGGNSSVFALIDPNDDVVYAVKISKFPLGKNVKQNERFEREIDALYEAKDAACDYVIDIIFDGEKKIGENSYRYYVMEKADYDLRSYVMENAIGTTQKVLLCHQIIKGIRELHNLNIYHRDIKPDNFFFISKDGKGTFKIGDLGLMKYRGEDLFLDKSREKIGPYGWLSPEAMNKVLCEGTKYEKLNDCQIDFYSDIFQLGKVFWFIFRYTVPIGQVIFSDFKLNNRDLFDTITEMIQHNKSRRKDIEFYYDQFLELSA